jgi:hypothetical protein
MGGWNTVQRYIYESMMMPSRISYGSKTNSGVVTATGPSSSHRCVEFMSTWMHWRLTGATIVPPMTCFGK